jgi:hypothetical protein
MSILWIVLGGDLLTALALGAGYAWRRRKARTSAY